jgi:hypothetical protein
MRPKRINLDDERLPFIVQILRGIGVDLCIEGLVAAFDTADLQRITDEIAGLLHWQMNVQR